MAPLVFALLAGSSGSYGDEPATTLKLGAWNIEWLGSPDMRSGLGRNIAQKPEDIAAYISESGVDILALEEIGDDASDQAIRTNSTLSQAFDRLNQSSTRAWDYILLPKKKASERTQLTGVAWDRNKVQFQGALQIPSLDVPNNEMSEWDRSAHGVKFSAGPGKSDFVVIPVHMKSNRGGSQTRRQRALEANLLVAQLDFLRQHFEDDDLVILGDTNCLNKNELAIQTFVDANFADRNHSDLPTTFSGPVPFDRIFVTANQEEFTNTDFTVLKTLPASEHKMKLSDHYMVISKIYVVPDRDIVPDRLAPESDPLRSFQLVASARGIERVVPLGPGRGEGEGEAAGRLGVAVAPRPGLRIARIGLRNGQGETQGESVTLRNVTDEPVDLSGWKLQGRAKTAWELQGTVAPGRERTVERPASSPILGVKGDRVELVDDGGLLVDCVIYQNAAMGREIKVLEDESQE